ncbi:cysteine desulfurase NifS [Candidatus Methanocrinis natronophilus]|uniref:Cysteine desulfurase IscS n=1 Tax=Candidatus Methanocrinis natronophilus TaxID=3033396 RepID=A0ABT5X509_9EURY|nr:cysteine desulfurase NifS [Candidatus Methanocrinis natronophilus]MDF0589785.1 cysteine desulfurase NifS [Candidatus Methanocrinis natronophilus]
MRRIYMDHAATTPLAPEVLEAMIPYFSERYGNPSSLHSFGREAREAVDDARTEVAALLNAEPSEIYFTSGGTESDNLALRGIARKNKKKGRHIITSSIEHPAVLEVCKALAGEGFEVTYLPVTREGLVEVGAVEEAVREDTILISVMHANNEIGTIQPLEEIGRLAGEKEIYFHTDGVQTAGKIPVDVRSLGVDAFSLSGHKLYGPKGAGALYIRKGVRIESIQQGGGHERGMRSGTENVPGIVGLGRAAMLAEEKMEEESERMRSLRDRMSGWVLKEIEDSWLNGHPVKRLPSNLNFGFRYIEGESLLLYLDAKGVAASTGSACSSKKLAASHVLSAIGLEPVESHGSLRITLGMENTEEDVDYACRAISESVARLREMSALRPG